MSVKSKISLNKGKVMIFMKKVPLSITNMHQKPFENQNKAKAYKNSVTLTSVSFCLCMCVFVCTFNLSLCERGAWVAGLP